MNNIINKKASEVTLSIDQFDKAYMRFEIAKTFLNFVSSDVERHDSVFQGLDYGQRQSLLCGISCLLDEGADLLCAGFDKPALS